MRWLVPEIGTMTHDQLQHFANGCVALACLKGNLDRAEDIINNRFGKIPPATRPDILHAFQILTKPDLPPDEKLARRTEFFKG
jgi:hypothetical protein